MKSHLKNSLHLCLIVSALMLTACGKKANKVNSTPTVGSSPFSTAGYAPGEIVNQMQSIKTNVTCMNGYRLNTDYHFHVVGGAVSGTKISAPGRWNPGVLSGGTVNKLWVGVGAYRDLMFVTQVANGSAVIGYNVTLSFCEMKNSNPTYPSVISNERILRDFLTPNGIILDKDTYCGYGVVDYAPYTYITSSKDMNNPMSPPDIQIPTSYAKPTCNGKF